MNNEELISFIVSQNQNKYYIAELSNGKNVYQDTREKGPHAWVRLKQFLQANKDLKITGLSLMEFNTKTNKSTSIDMPKNQIGYCFGKKMVKIFMGNTEVQGTCVGYFDGINATLFWVSEDGENVGKEIRSKDKCGFFLIEN